MKSIKDVRDAIAHPTSADLSVRDALVAIAETRQVLRHFDVTAAAQLDSMMSSLLKGSAPTNPGPKPTTSETFFALWGEIGQEEFLDGLIRFMQELGDMWGEVDRGHELEDKWHWDRGPENVALALQEMVLGTTDRFQVVGDDPPPA